MAHSKTTWLDNTPLNITNLDNLASQYDEAYIDFLAHNHNDLYYTKTEMDATFWNEDNDGSDSGCDADLLYSSGGNKHASDLEGVGGSVGMIIMWDSLTIPEGWHECDGTNGTRDLRDKFVIGAGSGSGLTIGSIYGGDIAPAGSVTIEGHILTTAEVMNHGHTYTDQSFVSGSNAAAAGEGSVYYISDGDYLERTSTNCSAGVNSPSAHGHPGSLMTGDEFTPLPPCKVLIYIQKI